MAELTYKNACIMYLEQNMECVNYRDYIVKQLNKLEQIENIVEDRNGKPPLTTLNEIVMVVEEWTYYKKKARENKDGKIG